MPSLWRILLLSPTREWPENISNYPHTASKRALSYVRTIKLLVYLETEFWIPSKLHFEALFEYLYAYLQVLQDIDSADRMSLIAGLYDPSNYPPDCSNIAQALNRTVLEITRRVGQMNIQRLELDYSGSTVGLEDMMSNIESNVDRLTISSMPFASWAPRFQYLKGLKELKAKFLSRFASPSNVQAETTFWTSISQLPNLNVVSLSDPIPIPSQLTHLSFPRLVSLELDLPPNIDQKRWTDSLVMILQQMTELEYLAVLFGLQRDEVRKDEWDAMRITTIAAKNLKTLTLQCPTPRGLISTIASNCPRLTKIQFSETNNVDNDDLYQLARSCPNLQQVRLPYAECITSLQSLTNLHQLELLDVYYLTGRCFNVSLLLKFVDSCPKLNDITVSGWRPPYIWAPSREFEETPPENLFPAAAELRSYFEPQFDIGIWTDEEMDLDGKGLAAYKVRIDKLRDDATQFRQLPERLGEALVRLLVDKC